MGGHRIGRSDGIIPTPQAPAAGGTVDQVPAASGASITAACNTARGTYNQLRESEQ